MAKGRWDTRATRCRLARRATALGVAFPRDRSRVGGRARARHVQVARATGIKRPSRGTTAAGWLLRRARADGVFLWWFVSASDQASRERSKARDPAIVDVEQKIAASWPRRRMVTSRAPDR
jgi:hypothetical protein